MWMFVAIPMAQSTGRRSCPTTAAKACLNCSGNALPRFSARRSIPAHAFALKKNLGGMDVVSSTCDNEHTAASLGQSEILSVENPPGCASFGSRNQTRTGPFPALRKDGIVASNQCGEEASEGVVLDGQDAGYIFPDDDCGLASISASKIVNCIGQPHKFKGQVAAIVSK